MAARTAPERRRAPSAPSPAGARPTIPPGAARPETLALELVNTETVSGEIELDRLETATDMVAWMREAHLLETPGDQAAVRSPAVARLLHDETLRLRRAIGSVFAAHAAGGPYPSNELHVLNRVLSASRTAHALEAAPSGFRVAGVEHGTGPIVLLVPVALSAAGVVTRITPNRLGQCAATTCSTWFVDTSKGGQRRWCSMAGCGNRAKASRHRRKHLQVE